MKNSSIFPEFDTQEAGCHLIVGETVCDQCSIGACGPEEQVLRAYAFGGYAEPMTEEQRAWCVEEADSAGEGMYTRTELDSFPDRDLAYTVLRAWSSYARSQGL